VKTWLVDTGPLVAYLVGRDPAHARVAARWNGFAGALVTNGAVITEAMHFVGANPTGPGHMAELVTSSSMRVNDLSQPPELREAAALMDDRLGLEATEPSFSDRGTRRGTGADGLPAY
jgi:predicted nucleic acid-binding protein